MMKMKLKELESELQEVDVFDDPKIELEQIPTSPHLASRFIYTAESNYGDIANKVIGDFGCGPGILSIASSMLGAASIASFDVDQEALDTAWVNINKLEITNIDLTLIDIQSLTLAPGFKFDTVIMNPPFGTRNTGIDTAFIEKAMLYSNVIYSLHKSSTRAHFFRLAESRGYKIEVVAEMKYDIPKTFKYHKEKSKDVAVDLLRFEKIIIKRKIRCEDEEPLESVFSAATTLSADA
jgi:rRNA N6-adenosine-methyltransferase METTL5